MCPFVGLQCELQREEAVFLTIQKFIKDNLDFWNKISEDLPLHVLLLEDITEENLENLKTKYERKMA